MTRLPFAKKNLGQHWLADTYSLQAMIKAANVQPGDVVLEIGPGTGTLTDELLAAGAEIIALEFDASRVRELERKYKERLSSEIFIQEGDIRSYDLTNMPEDYKIVANIPYYLTAYLLRKLINNDHKPTVAALLVQKEVAERVCAQPGNLSQLAVLTQIFYEPTLDILVPSHLFTPPPKVDSQILVLCRRRVPAIAVSSELFTVIKAGFSEKRKKLRTSLSGGLHVSKVVAEALLTSVQVDPNKRAQELRLDEWAKLAQQFRQINT